MAHSSTAKCLPSPERLCTGRRFGTQAWLSAAGVKGSRVHHFLPTGRKADDNYLNFNPGFPISLSFATSSSRL
jgi:hypothetical protein